jgi:hypothetical protein|tara:strand:+ start:586 stop:813 length:228 start_codon:yes stop_codon:yes gene_type:complete
MLGGYRRELIMINPKVLLGPRQACKYSFAVSISLLFLLLVSFSSQAKGMITAYSATIDDIIEEEQYKEALSNSED